LHRYFFIGLCFLYNFLFSTKKSSQSYT
jgi:hypothetical protein